VETELRPSSPSKKKQPDENQGLRTKRQIELYRQREAAKRERAERREVEARVRHLNFALIQRVVLLVMGVAIGIALIIGARRDPALLEISLASASVWGAIAAGLYRWEPKKTSTDSDN
jgi:hypothetical protein